MSRAVGPLGAVLAYLRQAAGSRAPGDVTDGQLLERFLARKDEAAFETLVLRHGPLVWGVCRRLLSHGPDAEDAFQATFLVLVRKAGSICKRESVESWLYGVAYRVAARARAQRGRSPAVPEPADVPADDPWADVLWRDLRAVLDEEVNRLAEKYRRPVVLCYLEGKSFAEAARLLRCPLGTVATRLARARQLLRPRLERRGVALSIAGLGTLLTHHAAPAAVPAPQVAAVVAAASGCLSGAAIPGTVLALAEGVIRAMWITNVRTAAAGLVLVAALVGTGTWGLRPPMTVADEPEPARKSAPPVAPKPARSDTARLASARDGILMVIGTDVTREEWNKLPADRKAPPIRVGGEERYFRLLKEGDAVQVGQLLAVIDDRVARDELAIKKKKLVAAEADLIGAQATVEEAEAQHQLAERLRKRVQGHVSEEEFRTKKLAVVKYKNEAVSKKAAAEIAALEVNQAQTILEQHLIRSPMRGFVKDIHKYPGEAVKAHETVIAIQVADK